MYLLERKGFGSGLSDRPPRLTAHSDRLQIQPQGKYLGAHEICLTLLILSVYIETRKPKLTSHQSTVHTFPPPNLFNEEAHCT